MPQDAYDNIFDAFLNTRYSQGYLEEDIEVYEDGENQWYVRCDSNDPYLCREYAAHPWNDSYSFTCLND